MVSRGMSKWPSVRSIVSGIALVALVVVGVRAQQQPARGQQPPRAAQGRGQSGDEPDAGGAPNKLGQPLLDPHGFVKDDAMLHAPALAAEDRKYADINGKRMKQFVMEVDAISLKDRDSGNLFWGRNVGTAGHVATQDWVEAYFRKHNLQNVHRMPFDLQPVWTPKAWDITFA